MSQPASDLFEAYRDVLTGSAQGFVADHAGISRGRDFAHGNAAPDLKTVGTHKATATVERCGKPGMQGLPVPSGEGANVNQQKTAEGQQE